MGRVFGRADLERLAAICLRREVLICSDEIHCDLVFEGQRHVPIASLDPEVARRSITLMAPSKTFNVAGLRCSFAIVPDPTLRRHFADDRDFSEINNMGLAAALAAYRDGQDWLDQVMAYLQDNRDFVVDYVRRELPGIEMAAPEATYLAWMDCRRSGIRAARRSSSSSAPASRCTTARGSARAATDSCASISPAPAQRSPTRSGG